MINDPKEREHWTTHRCCGNCLNKRNESPIWPFKVHYCVAKKKNLGCSMEYDHGCKLFLPRTTPEENKQFWLDMIKLGFKSRRQRGREYQGQLKRRTKK